MASENTSIFRQSDLKKDPTKLIRRSEYPQERERLMQSISGESKTVRRYKSPKKILECRKDIKDHKIQDVILNSEYFRHQSNNMASLSFCSGDNGEHRWTVNSKLDFSSRQKGHKDHANSVDIIKNEIGAPSEKAVDSSTAKVKTHNCLVRDTSQEKTEQFLEGILSGKGRIDRDLVTLITEQMFLAERELQITRTHLIETIGKLNERDLEIIQLYEKLNNLQKMQNSKYEYVESENKTSEDYQRLILASEKLKKQVKDMEEFLNDYGLIWVGDKELNRKPDFDKIIKNFQRLNSIAAQPKIIQTTLGAKFELPREISVALYSNGMLLRGSDFREYNKISTNLFLQDVEDGYFPSELQTEYPEGVPFEVSDKRNDFYRVCLPSQQHFGGKGTRLGSTFEDKPASVVFLTPVKESKFQYSGSAIHCDSVDKSSGKKMTPKKRIRSHHDETKMNLSRQSNGTCDRESSSDNSSPTATEKSSEKLLTLKIRYGKEKTGCFVVNACENDRLAKFHESLQRKLCERFHDECLLDSDSNYSQTDFEVHIYGKNPFRLIDNLQKRLKDFGITENCVVNVTEI